MTLTQTILQTLQTLTPQQQQQVINYIEFLQYQTHKTDITQEPPTAPSFYDAAQEYIGSVDGGPGDLATNKDYLKGRKSISAVIHDLP
jgi:hypothetical protein